MRKRPTNRTREKIRQVGTIFAVLAAILVVGGLVNSRSPVARAVASILTPKPPRSRVSDICPASTHPLTRIRNRAYTVGYSEEFLNPLWVKYELKQTNASEEPFLRSSEGFATDFRTRSQITSSDYLDSGYDRVLMAPSYAIGKFHGHEAQKETFTMSNIVPQSHFCNDGVWNSIERIEADAFPNRFGSIEVVNGPIFSGESTHFSCGVAVPVSFYKAIRRPDGEIIAFIVPQYPESTKPETYLTSIDEIKKRTGIDPFPDAEPGQKANQRKNIW